MSAHDVSATYRPYLDRWELLPDGAPVATRDACLLPVVACGAPAMLRLEAGPDGRRSGALMAWWDGCGAARVLRQEGDAVLMERATGTRSLAGMAHAGRDVEACRILCAVAAQLHADRATPPPALVPLKHWFSDLAPTAAAQGGILVRCANAARVLQDGPREVGVLHGDLHHGNVLDFGPRGWLAIDPAGLHGERGFDFANIFTNPDLADPARPLATDPARFGRRLDAVSDAAGLDRGRLLLWILAWSGLSASWCIAEGDPLAAVPLRVAALAAHALDG
ncbi:aminoglycoside phosphotransferase family protein [Xylophilus sp. Leaf220]|uniref:aminoglycoside phosphotransferase family protein n=1 Tax=Xylophilus sp. Leaf220 TaxID=1735686 RepID=UPI0006F8A822|nr:aminoglycoside phosphotransferase family protein [Xylophilus sp. Leaf220]KQM79505.1 streptomycin kinase [Xylophilus sp. Leaf220]